MKGKVKQIAETKKLYGIIDGIDGQEYYFNDQLLDIAKPSSMTDYSEGDIVHFRPGKKPYGTGRPKAYDVRLATEEGDIITSNISLKQGVAFSDDNSQSGEDIDSSGKNNAEGIIAFYKPGYSLPLQVDLQSIKDKHLKPNSGESDVLDKLSKLLYISRIGSHDLGSHNSLYQYCLIGATSLLKQFIRGKYEFLLVFSHFDNKDWQPRTNKAASEIRNRRDVAERRPLVNFYMLVSNARNLKDEIDKMKGGTEAVIIPFSFEEILSSDTDELKRLILERFSEYYFENNMLGEEKAIEEDTLLFGDRGKIADSIVDRCKKNDFSGIFGLRRSGKSSVLKAVLRRLNTAGIKYIEIQARSDLAEVSWKTALYDIALKIRERTMNTRKGETESKAEYYARLNLNSTESEYEKRATQCFKDDVKWYTKDEPVFVIAIDEVERIMYNTTSYKQWQDLQAYELFWAALRDSGCSLIVCGVNSTINEINKTEYRGMIGDNPMHERIHNSAGYSKTYLPSFTDEQTKVMINTLGSYSNVAFDNVYVEINRAFGGQPYAIRQFCAYMFDKIKAKRNVGELFQFTKPAFDGMIEDFCAEPRGIQLFETILDHVKIYTKEYEKLKNLAHTPKLYNKLDPKDISDIDHLEKYGLIEYDRSTGYVSFRIHSLQDYLVKTSEKRPEDMTNDERRRYVQDKVVLCERKLKRYIMVTYSHASKESIGLNLIISIIRKNYKNRPMPSVSDLREAFDHNKIIMYFSDIKLIIEKDWKELGVPIEKKGMDKNRFGTYMSDLNAGRTDADHYDPEDYNCPDNWEITEEVLEKFQVACHDFEKLFEALML